MKSFTHPSASDSALDGRFWETIGTTGRNYSVGVQESPPSANRLTERLETLAQSIKIPLIARPGRAIYHVMIKDFCNLLHYI